MEVIIVDDNAAYTEQLTEQEWSGNLVQHSPTVVKEMGDLSPRQIAKQVAREVGGDDAVVFINVNLKCEGKSRQEQAGVEVLKFLRLTERFDGSKNEARGTHCVMYSFQSVEQLLRQRPSSFILCSDGVTFKRLPNEFSRLDLRELAKGNASVDDLDKFLRGEFKLPDERHSWANWWGLKQLYDVHRLVSDQPDLGYPDLVTSKLNDLDALEGKSIYGHKSNRLQKHFGDFKSQINRARESLKSKSIVAIQIDDKWEGGWWRIFERMFYRQGEGNNLIPIGKDGEYKGDRSERLAENLKDAIESNVKEGNVDPEVILLDLRLLDEDAGQYSVEELSGVKLLKKLRKRFRGIPVIVTTASNKAWSHEALMRVGADGYWIKEGIDERKSPKETIRNYFRIIELLNIATEEEYRFLRWFDKKVQSIDDDKAWWISKKWRNSDTTNARKKKVSRILEESVLMFRSYLSENKMNIDRVENIKGSNSLGITSRDESFWVSAIVQQLSNIVEIVHNIQDGDTDKLYMQNRSDQIAVYLIFIRNYFSHEGWLGRVNFKDLKLFVELLVMWMENEDYTQGVRISRRKGDDWDVPDRFSMYWSNNYKEKYGTRDIVVTYCEIFWWLDQVNPRADTQVLRPHKSRLLESVIQLLAEYKANYPSQWSDIMSCVTYGDGSQAPIEERLDENAEEIEGIDPSIFR